MIISTKENEPESLTVDNASAKDAKKDVDYLNLDIKPLVSPTNSVSDLDRIKTVGGKEDFLENID